MIPLSLSWLDDGVPHLKGESSCEIEREGNLLYRDLDLLDGKMERGKKRHVEVSGDESDKVGVRAHLRVWVSLSFCPSLDVLRLGLFFSLYLLFDTRFAEEFQKEKMQTKRGERRE